MVLFSGVDTSGDTELWETNGTAAGTTELDPSSGTWSLGLFPSGLTALSQDDPPPAVATTPEVTAGANAGYTAGAAAIALDPGLSISDPVELALASATVSIGIGFLAGDTLSVGSSQAGVASSYNAGTGVLRRFPARPVWPPIRRRSTRSPSLPPAR